jgi:dihydrofolate reductase
MQKLIVFNHISLDGYFVDADGSMNWARMGGNDPEWDAFVAENASSGNGTLLFGRVTYELMIRYWPTPMAAQHNPAVAERMNSLRKVVFSRTLNEATWSNTRLIKSDLIGEVRRLKQESDDGFTVFGSGTIVSQLAQEGLIDEYQVIVNPIILGKGRTMFEGVKEKLGLKLTKSRTFGNGNVYLCYSPAV